MTRHVVSFVNTDDVRHGRDERELRPQRRHVIQLLPAEGIGADDPNAVALGGADRARDVPVLPPVYSTTVSPDDRCVSDGVENVHLNLDSIDMRRREWTLSASEEAPRGASSERLLLHTPNELERLAGRLP